MIKVVFLDLGNTLVTGGGGDRIVFEKSLTKLVELARLRGYEVDSEMLRARFVEQRDLHDELREKFLIEIHMKSWLGQLLSSACSRKIDEGLLKCAMQALVEARTRHATFYREVPSALQELKKLNYRLAVISNTSSEEVIHRVLGKLQLNAFFELVLTSAEFGVRKPYPGIFLFALKKLRVSPSESVFVGDSLKHDILGAKSIGMRTVLLDRKGRGAGEEIFDPTITSLEELGRVLKTIQ